MTMQPQPQRQSGRASRRTEKARELDQSWSQVTDPGSSASRRKKAKKSANSKLDSHTDATHRTTATGSSSSSADLPPRRAGRRDRGGNQARSRSPSPRWPPLPPPFHPQDTLAPSPGLRPSSQDPTLSSGPLSPIRDFESLPPPTAHGAFEHRPHASLVRPTTPLALDQWSSSSDDAGSDIEMGEIEATIRESSHALSDEPMDNIPTGSETRSLDRAEDEMLRLFGNRHTGGLNPDAAHTSETSAPRPPGPLDPDLFDERARQSTTIFADDAREAVTHTRAHADPITVRPQNTVQSDDLDEAWADPFAFATSKWEPPTDGLLEKDIARLRRKEPRAFRNAMQEANTRMAAAADNNELSDSAMFRFGLFTQAGDPQQNVLQPVPPTGHLVVSGPGDCDRDFDASINPLEQGLGPRHPITYDPADDADPEESQDFDAVGQASEWLEHPDPTPPTDQ